MLRIICLHLCSAGKAAVGCRFWKMINLLNCAIYVEFKLNFYFKSRHRNAMKILAYDKLLNVLHNCADYIEFESNLNYKSR